MAEDQIVKNLWLWLNTLAFGRPLKKIDRQAKANFLCCYLFINLISVTLAKNILHYLPIQKKNESFSLPILKCGQTKTEKKFIFWHFVVQSLQLLFNQEVSYFFNWNSYIILMEEIFSQLLFTAGILEEVFCHLAC